MTATDELRRLLTERGAEWHRTPHYSSESIDNETVFRGEGIEWIANDHLNGHIGLRALRYEVTPEQAVEATLGSDLEAENAELREERDTYRDLVGLMVHPDIPDQLAAENAELRELLQRTWDAFHDAPAREFFYVKNKLRELGIEVD